jgi:hypothetical protein
MNQSTKNHWFLCVCVGSFMKTVNFLRFSKSTRMGDGSLKIQRTTQYQFFSFQADLCMQKPSFIYIYIYVCISIYICFHSSLQDGDGEDDDLQAYPSLTNIKCLKKKVDCKAKNFKIWQINSMNILHASLLIRISFFSLLWIFFDKCELDYKIQKYNSILNY